MQSEDNFVDVYYEPDADDASWTLCTVREEVKQQSNGPIFKCILPSYVLFNPYKCYKQR